MHSRWIVVASSVEAKIYSDLNDDASALELVAELNHPEGQKANHELGSDRPGHYQTNHGARGSYEEKDAKEIGNEQFAKKLVSFLEDARVANKFHTLTLIVAPHLLGILEKQFSKPLKNLIDKIIQKNVIHSTVSELAELIKKEINKVSH